MTLALEDDRIDLAMAMLIQFDGYLRPSECLSLTTDHVCWPQGRRYLHWALIIAPSTLQQTTKTGQSDDSILLGDRPHNGWIKECMRLFMKTVKYELFPGLTLSGYETWCRQACLRLSYKCSCVMPHIIRHAAASNDMYHSRRSLVEIQKRGRWAAKRSDGVVLRDSEDQLQAFVALGGVERRYQLTAQEKMNEQGEHRFSVKSMSHERTHWYCEGCEKWLDSAGSQYSNSMAKSAIHLHHCHQLDRNRAAGAMAGQAPLPVTSKPKVFDVVKGQNLGCRLKVSATAPNAPRRLLQVYCPILSVLQVSEYAAGISSDRLKAFVRVIRADDEAQAEQDMAQVFI
ncbi:unnamed protein product [Cladocopium goreaui]|uniref:Uncharacterized protein n=1 Tax=Cladocopium goreaui TaxID=2562237 RepID=A0A9P1GAQ7_9DINO|nr:unnamed protein product [Cladocopium goreaui]